ncbi:MAG: class I SAM-dependent methyltransferase [Rickettsia endosymbiont of Pentastiridius leporinus]
MLKKNSIQQLEKAGLKDGTIIWDIGCGNGTMTEIMASRVADNGQVYAVDISEQQIQIAKQRIKNAGFKNVTFIVSDLYSLLNNNYPKADIVYSRLLLMHLQNPVEAIKLMSSLLKEGGVISLQESALNSALQKLNNQESNESFKRYYQLVMTYGQINGVHYDIGSKLATICQNLNIFSKVEHYISSYDFNEYKDLLLARYDEFKDKAVLAHLITEEESLQLREKLHIFFNSEELIKMNLKIDQHHLLLTL